MSSNAQHPRSAATCVVVRSPRNAKTIEILLLRRNPALRMDGNIWVFPGGKVESIDGEDLAPDLAGVARELAVARNAAVRETYEEAGLALPTQALVPLSHWTTPPTYPRRFATWFFVAEHSDGEVCVDGSEIVEHRWVKPAELLNTPNPAMRLYPPTQATLAALQAHRDVPAVLAFARRGPVYRNTPQLDADNNFFLHSEVVGL